MTTNRGWTIAAGVALWVPLILSFLSGLSLTRLPGMATSQALMVALLIAATLLLGVLIGRTAVAQESR